MATISRQENNNLFGPTVGDRIRLGNTSLYVQIEKDLRMPGDEVVYGGGKTIRDGMGSANTITWDAGSLDLVITNVTILDPVLGVAKADVGIRDGKIAGIGKAGNPNASLPTPQPVMMRPMFGAFGKAMPRTCVRFTSRAALDAGLKDIIRTDNILYPVGRTRQLAKTDMVRNAAMPRIEINPETFDVYGTLAYVPPAKELSLSQLYWFS